MSTVDARPLAADAALRARAAAVIPGGMYGHQNAAPLPAGFPQFMARGLGARVWDVDGNEYVDLMCSYGPVIVGHHHRKIDAAARAQQEQADCQNAPSPRMVELAEALTSTVAHADWAMFAKSLLIKPLAGVGGCVRLPSVGAGAVRFRSGRGAWS